MNTLKVGDTVRENGFMGQFPKGCTLIVTNIKEDGMIGVAMLNQTENVLYDLSDAFTKAE